MRREAAPGDSSLIYCVCTGKVYLYHRYAYSFSDADRNNSYKPKTFYFLPMKIAFHRALLCACVSFIFFLFACSKNDSDSGSTPPPTQPIDTVVVPAISSVSPLEGVAYTSVVIAGKGFSDTLTNNSVFFNGVKAELLSATKTQLTARVPLGAGTGKVTVSINGTLLTGPVFTYNLSYYVSTFAGNGSVALVNGAGAAASFRAPNDLVTDASGNIYVTDYNAIRKITPDGVVTTLAGSVALGSADGTGSNASFGSLTGIAIDANGTLYVSDAGNYRIRKVTSAGVVTTLAGSSYGFADGAGTAAQFRFPAGIGVDKNGNVFVNDPSNNRVRKITPDGVVSTFAGTGIPGANDGPPGTSATLNFPQGLVIDNSGNVFVSEGNVFQNVNNINYSGNNKIRKITPDGTVSTFAGSGTAGYDDGTGTAASLYYPYGLRFDSNGNLFVVDYQSSRIRKITPGGVVTTFAGSISGSSNGPLNVARFKLPTGIAIDNNGNFYIADRDNVIIRKISLQ